MPVLFPSRPFIPLALLPASLALSFPAAWLGSSGDVREDACSNDKGGERGVRGGVTQQLKRVSSVIFSVG